MNRTRTGRALPALLGIVLVALVSCRGIPLQHTAQMPPVDITPTVLDYTAADGFDALFESALVNQDPVIQIRTDREKPDWDGRLNAWIAAWNRGGGGKGRKARGQAPVPRVVIDGQSIREFRLLVNGLLDRVEDLAQSGSSWWAQERERARRVGLLRPYNLRFHLSEQRTIHLVFFHGGYSSYYPRHVQLLTRASEPPDEEWARTVECSRCLEEDGRHRKARLTGRDGE